MSTPTDPTRQPKGIPTGGQFAASAKGESGVSLTGEKPCMACTHEHDPNSGGACYEAACLPGCAACGDNAPLTEQRLDVDSDDSTAQEDGGEGYNDDLYNHPEECEAEGRHLMDVDDDGYCTACGHQEPVTVLDRWHFEEEPDSHLMDEVADTGADLLAETPHNHPGYAALREALDEWESLDEHDTGYAADIVAAIEAIQAAPLPFAKIQKAEWREACTEYATRYAECPDRPVLTLLGPTRSQAARDIQVGHRLETGQVVTHVDTRTPGVVNLYCDARANSGPADRTFNHGDPVEVFEDRADLSDPDWFEVEATRIIQRTMTDRFPKGGIQPGQADYDAVSTEVRRRLTRTMQPRNISPLHNDDPRACNGRAKVGDDVISESPMYGSTAYRVIGKMPYVTVTGHDGTNVTWGETGETEYVIENIENGYQSTSFLTDRGFRRIPAPGDNGPGARAAALR